MRGKRKLVIAAAALLEAATAHAGAPIVRSWPDSAPPCNGTLQACVDAAAPDDTVEIATNGPIAESISFSKSFVLRAASGFAPVFSGARSIFASTPFTGDHTIQIEGLTLEQGRITLLQASVGNATFGVVGNTIGTANVVGIDVQLGFGSGPLAFLVADNAVGSVTGNQAIGISVTSTGAVMSGEIEHNSIGLLGGNQQEGIYVTNLPAASSVDVIGNLVAGADFESGIALRQDTAEGSLAARVLDNVVTGAHRDPGVAIGIAAYASEGAIDLTVVNNTLDGNDTAIGIGVASGAMEGLVANNAITGSERGLAVDPASRPTVADRNNLFFGNAIDLGDGEDVVLPGPDSVFADPLYAGVDDFHLAAGSPAIGAGDDAAVPADLHVDFDGQPRRVGTVDIGAFEVPEAAASLGGAVAAVALAFLSASSAPRRARRAP